MPSWSFLFWGYVACTAAFDPQPRPVIVDMDPGADDLFALAWLCAAHRSGTIHLLAITTAAGNHADPMATFGNAKRGAKFFGCEDVPVKCWTPPSRKESDGFFGEDGLFGMSKLLPEDAACDARECGSKPDAPDWITQKLEEQPHEIVLLAVGPLTNLAETEKRRPGALRLAREVMVMGGAFQKPGNASPFSEFNIWFDAESAATVFASTQVTFFPLDVTHRICNILEQPGLEHYRQHHPDQPTLAFLHEMDKIGKINALHWGEPCAIPHDTLPVANLLYPGLFSFRRKRVHVDVQSQYGRTWSDDRLLEAATDTEAIKLAPNAWVAMDVDVEAMKAMFSKDLLLLLDGNAAGSTA